MQVLATGTTGTLGPHVLEHLAPQVEKLYILVRGESIQRARALCARWPNVVPLEGELTHPEVFADPKAARQVQGSINAILHMAARFELTATHADCFLHNVVGTQNMLYFAGACERPVHFHHLSTIAVAGDLEGEMPEAQVDLGQGHANHYAKTKYEAEMLVRHWRMNGAKSIYRPGIIVGDTRTGAFKKVEGPYFFLAALARARAHRPLVNALKYLPMPYDRATCLPMVPVDLAGRFLAQSVLAPAHDVGTRCYNLVAEGAPKVGRFLQDAFDAFGFKTHVVPLPDTRVNDLLMEKIGLPKELLEYLYSRATFSTSSLHADFPKADLGSYDSYKAALFSGALSALKSKKDVEPKKRRMNSGKLKQRLSGA